MIEYMTFSVVTRDIEVFADKEMGIKLTAYQLYLIDRLAQGKGKPLLLPKRAGYSTAVQVLRAYVDKYDGYIKHFDKTHFTAVTIGGRKFLYCPLGNIVTWSEGDYDIKWWEYCKKHFEEIAK